MIISDKLSDEMISIVFVKAVNGRRCEEEKKENVIDFDIKEI